MNNVRMRIGISISLLFVSAKITFIAKTVTQQEFTDTSSKLASYGLHDGLSENVDGVSAKLFVTSEAIPAAAPVTVAPVAPVAGAGH